MAAHALRRRVWEILDVAVIEDRASALFDVAIRTLIALNVVAVVLETVPALGVRGHDFFLWFEIFSVTVFSLEYLGRVWSCVETYRYRAPVWGRLRWSVTPLAIIDLLAVLPSLLPAMGLDLRMLRGVRLFRLFRILKMTRYSRSLHMMGRVFRRASTELTVTLSALGLILLVASSIMYYAEHTVQPDKFSSIPSAMWWGVVTLTTLGYGDVYPVTSFGRVMGGLFAISGILLIAIPTAILGAAFAAEMRDDDADADAPAVDWDRTGTGPVLEAFRPDDAPGPPGGEAEAPAPAADTESARSETRTCPTCGRRLDPDRPDP